MLIKRKCQAEIISLKSLVPNLKLGAGLVSDTILTQHTKVGLGRFNILYSLLNRPNLHKTEVNP